jgi:uncharacterized protein (TIGR00290 family)
VVCCSWSGGKDSCLALWRAVQSGARISSLVTILTEEGRRSRSHGLCQSVLAAQAAAIGIPLWTQAATWEGYQSAMIKLLRHARTNGATAALFGDIDIPSHRTWEEETSAKAGLTAWLPLWQQDRMALLKEFWSAGFECRIVVVRQGVVDRRHLGCVLDQALAEELLACGVDPCGENGEFHTLVTRGPLFRQPIRCKLAGQELRGGCWFQDLEAA